MRPSRDDMLMDMARVVARRSTCSRAHVGVVIAREGRPLVAGYNGAPAGMDHCDHPCTCTDIYLNQDPPRPYHQGHCPSTKPCTIAVHAEANAISFAARWGVSLDKAELHSTLCPCLACARLVINAGIIRVISDADYRDGAGLELLQNAGIALD